MHRRLPARCDLEMCLYVALAMSEPVDPWSRPVGFAVCYGYRNLGYSSNCCNHATLPYLLEILLLWLSNFNSNNGLTNRTVK